MPFADHQFAGYWLIGLKFLMKIRKGAVLLWQAQWCKNVFCQATFLVLMYSVGV